MARHLAGLIGTVELADPKVRDVQFALAKLAERLSTRSVRLAREGGTADTAGAPIVEDTARGGYWLTIITPGAPGRPQPANKLPALFRGGDRGGGHELGDLADGGSLQVVVADGAAHAGAGTWRWHQAYRAPGAGS